MKIVKGDKVYFQPKIEVEVLTPPGGDDPNCQVEVRVIGQEIPSLWTIGHLWVDASSLLQISNSDGGTVRNLAIMLRRMIWTAERQVGDTSMKVLAQKAKTLLEEYDLHGSPLRDEISTNLLEIWNDNLRAKLNEMTAALKEAISVFESWHDDETEVELLPRLRKVLALTADMTRPSPAVWREDP